MMVLPLQSICLISMALRRGREFKIVQSKYNEAIYHAELVTHVVGSSSYHALNTTIDDAYALFDLLLPSIRVGSRAVPAYEDVQAAIALLELTK